MNHRIVKEGSVSKITEIKYERYKQAPVYDYILEEINPETRETAVVMKFRYPEEYSCADIAMEAALRVYEALERAFVLGSRISEVVDPIHTRMNDSIRVLSEELDVTRQVRKPTGQLPVIFFDPEKIK